MDEESFEKLAEQAASGLKSDRELYLDVKQELRTHLEETADKFSREGHDADESADLAKKSFGSPLDVAADLLNANKRRMKLRALFRLAFGALIVPVAVLLALYLGYGRLVRFQLFEIPQGGYSVASKLPDLPFYRFDYNPGPHSKWGIPQLTGDSANAGEILKYWQAHRNDPDGRIYYAYYALFFETNDERACVEAMRLGEQIEPQNALYNVILAQWYLKRGMQLKRDLVPGMRSLPATDQVLDKRYFDLGVAELKRAIVKPYLRTYQVDVLHRKLAAIPAPVLTWRDVFLWPQSSCRTWGVTALFPERFLAVQGC